MRDAYRRYEAAVQLTSDPALLAQTYANLGAAYRALGEDDAAHKNFDQSLRFNPNQFNAWLGLGLLAQKQGKLDEAVSDLSRSLEIRPTAEGYLELGRTLGLAGILRRRSTPIRKPEDFPILSRLSKRLLTLSGQRKIKTAPKPLSRCLCAVFSEAEFRRISR